jgi:NTE family protein
VNFYQPLDPEQKFFVGAGIDYSRTASQVFQNNEKLAQYNVDRGSAGLWLGANIGSLGQARLGALEQYVRFERDIGSTYWPEGNTHYFGWRADLVLDQFNRLYFPTKGWGSRLEYFNSPEANFSHALVAGSVAGSIGNTVGMFTFRYNGSPSGRLPIYEAAKLGGIDNMAAFARGQIAGDDIYYLGARLEYILGKLPIGINSDFRVGINLEGAHVGEYYTETNLKDVRFLNSSSVYLGGATPIGPLYLGFGYSTNGSSNLFFSLGVPFNRP